MDSREIGHNQPMSSSDQTYAFARRLIEIERAQGKRPQAAICDVARRLHIGAGTLQNILRKRVKSISVSVGNKITEALIAAISWQIESLENELCKVRGARRANEVTIAEIETDIAALRARIWSLKNG